MGPIGLGVDSRGRLAALALFAAIGCGGSEEPARSAADVPREPITARRLLPLEHDTVFSYETSTDAGDHGLMVLQIRRPRPGLVELDIAGRVQRLDVDERSVMHSSGGYLLKDPIAVGSSFQGAFGAVRIERVDETVELPAGRFEGCVVTIEETAEPFKRAESTYCPDVGLVSLVVEGDGIDVTRVESLLKNYGPKVTLR